MKKILPQLLHIFLRIIGFTYRIRFHPDARMNLNKAQKNGRPFYVYAVWHQNIIAAVLAHMGKPHIVLVSPSKDGEYVAVTCEKMGYIPFRGSSNNQGRRGMQQVIARMKEDILPSCVTVDGPLGPVHHVKAGAVEIARQTKAPLLALCPVPEKYWSFNSWDRFRLPKPFTRIVITTGSPRHVNGEDNEKMCSLLKQDLVQGEEFVRDFFAKNGRI